jgi:hypothetical protein
MSLRWVLQSSGIWAQTVWQAVCGRH